MKVTPCNKNASSEVKAVLKYFCELSGKGIVLGQHTKTKKQEELIYIREVTGREPALCGFELLAYSPNIKYDQCDSECQREVDENKGTLEEVRKWADKKGLITFTWHWFSPIGGTGKSFYSKNTDFDVSKVLIRGTMEQKAFQSDMDSVAEILKTFQEKKIPIIWRPFHEAEGVWFWWGRQGVEVAKQLYLMMYDRYTNYHQLNNLIWVWNSPLKEGYVGDDFCDVISMDMYPPAHQHQDHKEKYEKLKRITEATKIIAVAEIGTIPSVQGISHSKVPWAWFMTWCNEFATTEEFTDNAEFIDAYHSDYAITLDKLPILY